MLDTTIKKEKAILIYVCFNKKEKVELYLDELNNLAQADNLEVVGEVVQNLHEPDPAYLIGKGKLEEVKQLIKQTQADMIIFDNSLSGSKIRNNEQEFGIKVIDRPMLILDIFASRALSKEGKLQVELAQLKYTLPRLSGISESAGRFGSAGVGMRGPGETKLELDKRDIERKILDKTRELKMLKKQRDLRREKRDNSHKKKVAIVGYTNSGKSTLLNVLTKANVLAKNMLFATLDTTTRNLWFEMGKECLLTDTVGFVSRLPHELVEAFHSTLEEAVNADIIVHVVDASQPNYREQETIVLGVLKDLGVINQPIITVYNKIDLLSILPEPDDNGIFISAKNNIGINILKDKIKELL